ncbi:MAG: hypothetical protein ACRDHN_08385, partial [Thermomicrobiales bacterium]
FDTRLSGGHGKIMCVYKLRSGIGIQLAEPAIAKRELLAAHDPIRTERVRVSVDHRETRPG